jgi:hypothetical protein
MSSVSSRLAADVVRLEGKIDRVLALLEQQRPTRRDSAGDARLQSAFAAVFGGAVFSVADVFGSHDAELVQARCGFDARRLGVRLYRWRRQPIGPYGVQRHKRGEHGVLWSLYVRNLHTASRNRLPDGP